MLEYAPNQNTLIRNSNNFPHCVLILNIQIELTTRLKQSTKIFVVFGQQVKRNHYMIDRYDFAQSLLSNIHKTETRIYHFYHIKY